MSGVNKVILVGRLGADVELKYTPSNRAVCNLSIATSEVWKDKQSGERKEKTEWHKVQVWGDQAENCSKFLAKGREVFVEGKLQTRDYEKDGVKRYVTEVVAERVVFLGGGKSEGQGAGQHREEHAQGKQTGWGEGEERGAVPSGPAPDEDSIPF